jgi:PAS domain S-box-containing protein
VEEATDAIFTIDMRGNFTSVNRSLEEAGGVQREHLIGRRCVTIIDPRDREMGEDAIRRTLAGERLQLSVRYPSPEGRILIGSLISAPIFEDGVVVGALGIMRYVADEPLQLPA